VEEPGAGRGELDRQGQTIQPPADGAYRGRNTSVKRKLRQYGARAFDEQAHRRRGRGFFERCRFVGWGSQRPDGEALLATQAQCRTAGGQQPQLGAARHKFGQ
jgi:hypothetical protein